MNRKIAKIDLYEPFPNLHSNWELIHEMESSLNNSLTQSHLYTNVLPN